MPIYNAPGISVHLRSSSLVSTTMSPRPGRSSAKAREAANTAARELKQGSRMVEREIDCLKTQSDGMPKFLGSNTDIPFFCVEACERKPQKETTGLRHLTMKQKLTDISSEVMSESSGLSSPPPSPDAAEIRRLDTHSFSQTQQKLIKQDRHCTTAKKPKKKSSTHALLLPIMLPTPSISSCNPATVANNTTDKALALTIEVHRQRSFCRLESGVVEDMKAEVYFNGQFANCTYWAARLRSDAAKDNDRLFSGCRTGRTEERAWILRTPDPSLIPRDVSKFGKDPLTDSEAEHRWQEVARSLQLEVERIGTNKEGILSPSGEYLIALATLPMPEDMKNRHYGHLGFGVVDVVISLGSGRKYSPESGHLQQPQRMEDSRFVPKCQLKHHMGTTTSSPILDEDCYPHTSDFEGGLIKELISRGIDSKSSNAFSRSKQSLRGGSQDAKKLHTRQKMARSCLKLYDVRSLRSTMILCNISGKETTSETPNNDPVWRSHDTEVDHEGTSKFKLVLSNSKSCKPLFADAHRTATDDDDDLQQDSDLARHPKRKKTYSKSSRNEHRRSKLSGLAPVVSPSETSKGSLPETNRPPKRKPNPQIARTMSLRSSTSALTVKPPAPEKMNTITFGTSHKAEKDSELLGLPQSNPTVSPKSGHEHVTCSSLSLPKSKDIDDKSEAAEIDVPDLGTYATKSISVLDSERPVPSSSSAIAFEIPSLSENSLLTYRPGVTRQVKAERPGEFLEREVLMGVRFLVLGSEI